MSNQFFQQIIFSNTVASWLISLGVIVFFFFFSKGISKLVAWLSVKYFTKLIHRNFREIIEKRIVHPLSKWLFWMITIITLLRLNFPAELQFAVYKMSASDFLTRMALAWLIILFFNVLIGIMYMVAAVFQRRATKRGDRSMLQLAGLLSDLVKAILVVLCILLIFKSALKIPLSSFVTSLGLVTAALALAAKDTVENIICSIIILIDKPFFIGDYISVGGVGGNVEKIGLRRTMLRTDQKTAVTIPNRDLTGNKLENVSNQTFRRFKQELKLAPVTLPEKLNALVSAVKARLEADHPDLITSYNVFFKSTGDGSHVIYMEYFVEIALPYADFCLLNQRINLDIVGQMQSLDIEMAAAMVPHK